MLVAGYEKKHDAKLIAQAYSVSKYTAYHLAQQKRTTSSVALKTSQRGRKRILSKEDKTHIGECIDEKPDITIEEIRGKLNLTASYTTVQRAIVELGYSIKKKMIHASEQERPRCTDKTYTMDRKRDLKHD